MDPSDEYLTVASEVRDWIEATGGGILRSGRATEVTDGDD